MNFKLLKNILLVSGFVVLLTFVLPNIFNSKEERAFSDAYRIAQAQEKIVALGDSLAVVPGEFYNRSEFFQWFLGSNYRDLWQEEVKVPVLDLSALRGGLTPKEFSGGQQTIGIEVADSLGRIWSIRSVNKDQANALADFLKPTFLRPMFRDQTSSLNPYAAPVTAALADAVEIHHPNPELYYFPYDESFGKYNQRMAGRLVLINEEVDEGWAGAPRFDNPVDIIDSDDMLKKREEEQIPIDSIQYLRSRLFDLLIADWDRHEGNWKWLLKNTDSGKIFEPFPVDRDMAFYKFGEGVINDFASVFVDKFQSFKPRFENVKGLMHQSEKLDKDILRHVPREEFLTQAKFIQQQLSENTIEKAYKEYPPEVNEAVGTEHAEILRQRLEKLPEAAEKFYRLINKE